ncbi:MAG: transketolase [Kiritimatiellae bacterium]|nr:transketolase [Kiritimatiellia bacterium]
MIAFNSMNVRIWSMLGSCGAFGQAALDLPEVNDRVVVLTSDLCVFSGLERFRAKFPDRLYNVGIAEQNMVGVAAGFAKEGFVPFATTYAAFASMRCADQVKVNMGYMGLPIKLVGLTAGFAVGALGATHMSLEDVAVMRAIPNVTLLSPADCTATVKAVQVAATCPGPVYLRLSGPMPNPIVYKGDCPFEIGRANTLRDGTDVSVIATGSMVYQALKAAELLEGAGVSTEVIDMHTIQPLDEDVVNRACGRKLIVTVEEHSVVGGLGSAVAERIACCVRHPRLLMVGHEGRYPLAGSYGDLIRQDGLDAESIYKKVIQHLKEKT